jgi:hypothetical protein
MRSRRPVVTRAAVAVVAVAAVVAWAFMGAGAFRARPSAVGHVQLMTDVSGKPAGGTPNAQLDPFGRQGDRPGYSVPPPPGQPTLVPTIGTKTTQRIYGVDPFQEAVSVTQHIWPAALPEKEPVDGLAVRRLRARLTSPRRADPRGGR